jgi:ubiquinone/menaquinone biosynthesis C-methylase UbiE
VDNKDLFNTIAEEYDELLPQHVVEHYRAKRVRFLKEHIGEGDLNVLDLGCGTGAILKELKSAGWKRFGMDESSGMLKKASADGIGLVCGQSAKMPFKNAQFDAVFCVAMLHHLYDPKALADTITEIIRVTKKGGKIILWDHNPLNPYWVFLMRRMPQDRGNTRTVFAGEIIKNVLNNRAKIVKIYRLGWMPDFAPKSMVKWFSAIENMMEKVPFVKNYSAHNIFIINR